METRLQSVNVNVSTDLMDETVRFYRDVMGMRFYDGPEPLGLVCNQGLERTLLQQGTIDTGMLGLCPIPPSSPDVDVYTKREGLPYPVILVFAVRDIEQVYQRAADFGARLIKAPNEWEIPNLGTAKGALFLDPLGILMDLTQLPADNPTNPAGEISAIRRITLPVPNGRMEEIIDFYTKNLSLKVFYDAIIAKKGADSGLGVGDYRVRLVSLQAGERTEGMVGLMEYLNPEMPLGPFQPVADGRYPVTFDFAAEATSAAGQDLVDPNGVRVVIR